jgi:hypothetical protein
LDDNTNLSPVTSTRVHPGELKKGEAKSLDGITGRVLTRNATFDQQRLIAMKKNNRLEKCIGETQTNTVSPHFGIANLNSQTTRKKREELPTSHLLTLINDPHSNSSNTSNSDDSSTSIDYDSFTLTLESPTLSMVNSEPLARGSKKTKKNMTHLTQSPHLNLSSQSHRRANIQSSMEVFTQQHRNLDVNPFSRAESETKMDSKKHNARGKGNRNFRMPSKLTELHIQNDDEGNGNMQETTYSLLNLRSEKRTTERRKHREGGEIEEK